MSASRSVLHLAWPLVLSFWMRQLFTFVDTYFAASIGDHAVAGIGLAFPYEFVLVAFWIGTSTGMTSLLSRAFGAREGERIEQVIAVTRRIVLVLVPLFLLLGVAIWVFPRAFVAEGVSDDVLGEFRMYGSVIVAGTALTGFWSVIPDSIVKAHHDTRATMWAGIASNLTNVALNALFLWVFHWGMFGIAFSTVLGRLAGLGYALAQARLHESRRLAAGLDTVPGRLDRPYRSLLLLAVPAAAAYVLMATESGILNALLARAPDSTSALAAFSIYGRFLMFFMMPVIACGVALLPYTARAYGARDIGAVRGALREVSLAGVAYCLLLVLPVTWFLGSPLIAALAQAPETRALAGWALRVTPLACLVAIPFFACRPVFEGLGRGAPGLVIAGLRYVVLTGPLGWLGMRMAERAGAHPMHGLVLSLALTTAIASAAFAAWTARMLREAEGDLSSATV